MADSSLSFSSAIRKLDFQVQEGQKYSVELKDARILLYRPFDTVELNNNKDTLPNINMNDEFVSTRKLGQSFYVVCVYVRGKVRKLEILSELKKIELWLNNFDKIEIEKLRVSLLDVESTLSLIYSLDIPYQFDYYNKLANSGMSLIYDLPRRIFSDALLYISEPNVEADGESKPIAKMKSTAIIHYGNNGVIKMESLRRIGCELKK